MVELSPPQQRRAIFGLVAAAAVMLAGPVDAQVLGGPLLPGLLNPITGPIAAWPSPNSSAPPRRAAPVVSTVVTQTVSPLLQGAAPVVATVPQVVNSGVQTVGGVVVGATGAAETTVNGLTGTAGGLTGGALNTVGGVVSGLGRPVTVIGGNAGNLLLGGVAPGASPPPISVSGNLGAATGIVFVPAPVAAALKTDLGPTLPLGSVSGALDGVAALTDLRRLRGQALIRENPQVIEADAQGEPVLRGEVLAISPEPAALAKALRAGFTVKDDNGLEDLGLRLVTLRAPPGMTAIDAVAQLRTLDRKGRYDLNHLYQPSGEVRAASGRAPAAQPLPAAQIRIGLIDGAVPSGQPSLSGVKVIQQAFAGALRPTPHAAAVASLLAGRQGAFSGAAPGGSLYVADVYGGLPTGGSASDLARALAWMAQNRVPVINISLVGPPNLTLGAAIQVLVARGHLVVAAVGNDGPAAAPLYPAAYRGVIAVTGVDGRKKLLPEAGRGTHVDFAAPGADMAAAGLDGGFVSVRGTSFAAPLAAGRLARLIAIPDPAAAARAVATVARDADDLGPRGTDRVYGKGLVAFDLRTDPITVAARGPVMRGP